MPWHWAGSRMFIRGACPPPPPPPPKKKKTVPRNFFVSFLFVCVCVFFLGGVRFFFLHACLSKQNESYIHYKNLQTELVQMFLGFESPRGWTCPNTGWIQHVHKGFTPPPPPPPIFVQAIFSFFFFLLILSQKGTSTTTSNTSPLGKSEDCFFPSCFLVFLVVVVFGGRGLPSTACPLPPNPDCDYAQHVLLIHLPDELFICVISLIMFSFIRKKNHLAFIKLEISSYHWKP